MSRKRGYCAHSNYLYSLMTPVSLSCQSYTVKRERARSYCKHEHVNRIRLFQRSLTREKLEKIERSIGLRTRIRERSKCSLGSMRRP